MNKLIRDIAFFCIVFVLLSVFCTNFDNPYLNSNESRAVFSKLSIHNGDTVPIFNRDSFNIDVYLREYLKDFSLKSDKNRFWTDTTINISNFNNNSKKFFVSFYDTGWHEISLYSHLQNGETAYKEVYRIYVYSPLNQNTLEIQPGQSIKMSTSPVSEDVLYVWDLHSITLKNNKPEVYQTFKEMPESTVGELYVIDRKDRRSPSCFFIIKEKSDAVLFPGITLQNDSVTGDTVYSSTPTLQLAGNITGVAAVQKLTLNDIEIKTIKVRDGLFYFNNEFKKIDSLSPVRVIAQFTNETGNVTNDTFFIKYTHAIKDVAPSITIHNPSHDSTISNNKYISINGSVENYDKYPSGVISYSKNGNTHAGFIQLQNGMFSVPVELDDGPNIFILKFLEDTLIQNTLSKIQGVVFYDQGTKDTTGPSINVFCNGKDLSDSALFRTKKITLSVQVYDISSIAKVMVNGAEAVLSADSINHIPTYISNISLEHPKTIIEIEAVDNFQNSSVKKFSHICHNQLPVISGDFSPKNGVVGVSFTWKPVVTDPDNDTITLTATINGKILPLSPDGSFNWTPQVSDTGWQKILVQVYDKHEQIDTSFDINVKNANSQGVKVKWLTDTSSIPDTLVISQDTLKVNMRANALSNLRPFHYKAELTDIDKVLIDGNDSTLSWIPEQSDLGLHTIKFTIIDNGGNSDEFTDLIKIVKKPTPVVQFQNISGSCTESQKTYSVYVTLSRSSETPVTVDYSIDMNPSTPNEGDYTAPVSNQLTFAPGELSKPISFSIIDDIMPEQDEKITLRIRTASDNAVLGSQTVTSFTIKDDDHSYYSFVTDQSSGDETDGTIDTVRIEVTLSSPLQTEAAIKCSIADEFTTASTNTTYLDYIFPETSQLLNFPAGVIKDTVLLMIKGNQNHIYEANEVVALKLSSDDPNLLEGNIILYKYTIKGTNESAPFVIDQNFITVSESNEQHNITISRSMGSYIGNTVTMYFSVVDSLSTAVKDVDYTLVTKSPLEFPVWGSTSYSNSITIQLIDDNIKEETKKIVLNITKISSYGYISGNKTIEITINDND